MRGILALLLLLALSSCESQEDSSPLPTEPWRRGEAAETAEGVDRRLRMRIEPDQWLDFELSGADASVRGRVPVKSAELRIDPESLEHVRGRLVFDLLRLEVLDRAGEDCADCLGKEAPADLGKAGTAAARRWLGLGSQVSREKKQSRRHASFRLDLARLLTAHASHRGKVLRDQDGRDRLVRRVRGTICGDLALLGIEVMHRVRADMDFFYDSPPDRESLPEALEVRLLEKERIPLVEHDIKPRSEEGRVMAARLDAAKQQLGSAIRVSGTLRFTSRGTQGNGANAARSLTSGRAQTARTE